MNPKEVRDMTVQYAFQGKKEVPVIKLQGLWLKNAGFDIKDKVMVIVKNGEIQIVAGA